MCSLAEDFLEFYINLLLALSSNSDTALTSGPEITKLFSCSAQLRMKFIMLINVKMPTISTIVGILAFISVINATLWRFKARDLNF